MSERPEIGQEEFVRLVHDALTHLYDAAYLHNHPLLPLLGLESAAGKPVESQRARKILLDGIEAMKPARGIPAASPLWRGYHILQKRFIEGLSSSETMAQLGLGKSQFFIEQKKALEALAAHFLECCPPRTNAEKNGGLASETLRLARDGAREELDLAEALRGVEALVRPLFEHQGILLETSAGEQVVVRGSERVLLRQSILVLLSCLAENRASERVRAAAYDQGERRGICFTLHDPNPALEADLLRMKGLETCQQLVASTGGTLRASAEAGSPAKLWIEWLDEEDHCLLVVDDNEEYARLFRRYLAGYPWKVSKAGGVAQAQQALRDSLPDVITIDILMPGQDGWELLTALKRDPATRQIPVFICSVLNEQQLAKILGVAEYLPKPVSRDDLLKALARVQVRS